MLHQKKKPNPPNLLKPPKNSKTKEKKNPNNSIASQYLQYATTCLK